MIKCLFLCILGITSVVYLYLLIQMISYMYSPCHVSLASRSFVVRHFISVQCDESLRLSLAKKLFHPHGSGLRLSHIRFSSHSGSKPIHSPATEHMFHLQIGYRSSTKIFSISTREYGVSANC